MGLPADVLERVGEFAAIVHDRLSSRFKAADFTVRDFEAWKNYVRFFTPRDGLGDHVKTDAQGGGKSVKGALHAGAEYVYRDLLETEADRAAFDLILKEELAKLTLPDPSHGKNAVQAKALLKLAEPSAESLAVDEQSPFRVPVSELVPQKAHSELIMTNETLRRLDSAYNAFALRDPMLMVGPPAAIKSALPRYMAAEMKIPYLAVTMHPGIGTFELVGGYRPRELKIHDPAEASGIVGDALARAASSGEAGAFIDAGFHVYGSGTIEEMRAKASEDLSTMTADPEAMRRIVTLAHSLRYGESSLAWQDGYLTYAIKRDLWINFEELNAAPTEVLEFLNDFMRTKRLVITQKIGKAEVVSPRRGGRFMLWATMNPETDSNRNVLARTLKNRWRVKYFGDIPGAEMAEILERKFSLPATWALALVENVHKTLSHQAHDRVIGQEWRDGYVFNFRHLLRTAHRWKSFVDALPPGERGGAGSVNQLRLLAREALSVYGGPMRQEAEKRAVFTLLDQALKLSDNGITRESITPAPSGFEDLGDRIRILDVEIRKGPGGAKVPIAHRDFLADAPVWARIYEYAKSLSLGEPILLMGESGAGKTTELEYLFSILGYNLHYKNLDSDTAHEEVVGGYVTGDRRGSYVFSEGMLPEAMEEGSAVFLDEFNLNPLVEWMNTVVDDGTLYLPHRIVRGRPFLVAAANPPEPSRYGGRMLLSPAVRSRWQEFWVPRDLSRERLKRLMTHWLSGGARLFGRGADGMASWVDAARDLWGRATSKKKGPEPVESERAPESGPSKPAALEDLLKSRGVPETEWLAVRSKVARLATQMRMVGVSVGRDSTLDFKPGAQWAYFPGTNTITYPLVDLLTHTEEEVMGVIDHEGGHRDITVLEHDTPLVRKYFMDETRHFLWNAIEDPRVNNWVKHRLPGAEHYLHLLYDRYMPESSGPLPAQPSAEEIEKAMKGDAGTAFDPRFLGMPHIEFTWAVNYYWRHGKAPELRSPSAREAFDKARPDLDKIFTRFPRDTDPSREQRLAYALDALKMIDEKILPLYEPLVKRSEEKLAKSMRNKNVQGQSLTGKQKEGSQDGDKHKNDAKQPGTGGQEKKGWWDRFKKKPAENADDGEPDPKRPRDKFDDRAKEAIEKHAKKAADDLAPKVPESKTSTMPGASSSSTSQAGSQAAKPLSLADVLQTQRDIFLTDQASPYERIYRQVADAGTRMVTHLENIFQKNARPSDVGYYHQGRRLDIKRAMRREGEGGGRDDVWLKRTEATKRRYKVSVVVDESGSMYDKRRYALQAVVMLVDALHRIQIDVEVIGFSDSAQVHLPFGRPLSQEEKEKLLANLDATVGNGGATHDADAVMLALERINAEEGDGKFILVITDGDGNGPSKLSSVLPQAEAAGVGVIGVGVGEGMGYVKTSYPRHVLVPDYSQLPLELKTRIEAYIQERELGGAAGSRNQYGGMGLWSAPSLFFHGKNSIDREDIPKPLEEALIRLWNTLPDSSRPMITAALQNSPRSVEMSGRLRHPFFSLGSKYTEIRTVAWKNTWPMLKIIAGKAAVIEVLRERARLASMFDETDLRVLADLGQEGIDLAALYNRDAIVSHEEVAAGADDSSAQDLERRAQQILIAPGDGFIEARRRQAVADALDAWHKATAPDEKAISLSRLKRLLDGVPEPAQ